MKPMKKRNARQEVIRELVRGQHVRTQSDLVKMLQERGFSCTQATVSRDITEMNLRKLPEGAYVLAEDLHMQRMVIDLVLDVVRSDNLVLIKASPGSAAAVAAALDAADLDGILGSVAGDDTILVIGTDVKGAEEFERVMNKLRLR